MLVLESGLSEPTGLAFSPDGQSLLAVANDRVQVWPRWLDKPPRPVVNVPGSLERYSFSPDARHVHLYQSGNSRTGVLTVSTGKVKKTAIPEGGPAYFHFDTTGGFALSSHGRGSFGRFDYAPEEKTGFRQAWLMERRSRGGKSKTTSGVGSHYYFGAICGPAGVFVSLEYRFNGRNDPYDGLVVREVTNGKVLYRKKITTADVNAILRYGLKLSVHPSGRYFAIPYEANVRLWPMATKVKLPTELEKVDLPLPVPAPKKDAKKRTRKPPAPVCQGVAFHPAGEVLATVGNDGTVKFYDTTTWTVTRTFAWEIGPLRAVCFTQDGTRAAAISAGKVRGKNRFAKVIVWDMDL